MENNRQNLYHVQNHQQSKRSIEILLHYTKPTYNCHFKDLNLKVHHHWGHKWFIHGPKRRKAQESGETTIYSQDNGITITCSFSKI